MSIFRMLFQIILNVLIFCAICDCLSCKNENNEDVEWFVIYKLPKDSKNTNSLIREGVAYMSITAKTISRGWELSKLSINSSKSMPAVTIQPYFDKRTSMHILYNDQSPSGSSNENCGHTKGVIMSNDTHGHWMLHSVPHFPPAASYHYPKTGIRYGQSFFCISTTVATLNDIGLQLQYNHPFIYERKINHNLPMPHIINLINNITINTSPFYHILQFQLNNEHFLSFAKTGKFGKDLYHDWVAVVLNNDLLVETWLNGDGRLPSNCTNKYSVNNIKSLSMSTEHLQFSSSRDHSKWTITNSKSTLSYWVCVGDINREEHQKFRGGGTLCIENKQLWHEYWKLIKDIELCKTKI